MKFAEKLRASMPPPPPPPTPTSVAETLRKNAQVLARQNFSFAIEKISTETADKKFVQELRQILPVDGWRTIEIDEFKNEVFVKVTW